MKPRPETAAEIVADAEARLFEAGITLASLPARGLMPSTRVSAWRDTLMDMDDLLSITGDEIVRPPIPSAAKISRMDEALNWVAGIPAENHRRVMLLWMMINPISRRHRYSWRQIGDQMRVSHHTAKGWFSAGLSDITKKNYA
ncbi:DUF6362 family protein [Acetobacter cerevisiae]|uniref:DUF6362 family protein n=1 Tax=Acetobacter cerevisiae TaxID=178900 RepID=UPI00209C761B|nr:DUF6362 family protein [Acetobacter cerevisiae]MCP1271226.1 DUF6362 family protein [Acetobacter cerevisiae]MCP1279180.1 DUF6362 family protein [Acetobacter cerevisiae]